MALQTGAERTLFARFLAGPEQRLTLIGQEHYPERPAATAKLGPLPLLSLAAEEQVLRSLEKNSALIGQEQNLYSVSQEVSSERLSAEGVALYAG